MYDPTELRLNLIKWGEKQCDISMTLMWMTGRTAGLWGQELMSSIYFSRELPDQAGTSAPLAAQFYWVDVGIALGGKAIECL